MWNLVKKTIRIFKNTLSTLRMPGWRTLPETSLSSPINYWLRKIRIHYSPWKVDLLWIVVLNGQTLYWYVCMSANECLPVVLVYLHLPSQSTSRYGPIYQSLPSYLWFAFTFLWYLSLSVSFCLRHFCYLVYVDVWLDTCNSGSKYLGRFGVWFEIAEISNF